MGEASLIAFVVAFLWSPIAIMVDWTNFLGRLPPREAELAKASHGVGLIVCGGYALLFVDLLPDDWQIWAYGIYAAMACLGLFWLCLGASRAQIYGDRRLQIRAVMKIAVAAALFVGWMNYVEVLWLAAPIVPVLFLWCWATGVTKLLICSRSMPRPAEGPINSYGQTDYPERATGLRGEKRE